MYVPLVMLCVAGSGITKKLISNGGGNARPGPKIYQIVKKIVL